MRIIYKQQLNVNGISTRFNSKIEKVLKLDNQNGIPTMWYIFNNDYPEVEYIVHCYGTGWPLLGLGEKSEFIGTVEDGEGYIWHYFAALALKNEESG